ncbi:hypothetical protein HDV00_008839 [Rhizophlyctis rosea]|nr:hypothetical protein HDV00_008839 [Rhizophlyctis rosea]
MYSDRYTPPFYGRRHVGRDQSAYGKNGRNAKPFQRGGKAVLPGKGMSDRYQNNVYKAPSSHQTVRNRVSKQRRNNNNYINNNMNKNRGQRWPTAAARYDIALARQYLPYSPAADGYRFPKRSGSNWIHSQGNPFGRGRRQQLQRDRLRRESSPAMRRQRSVSYQPSLASIASPLSRISTPLPAQVAKPDTSIPASPETAQSPAESLPSSPSNLHVYYDHLPPMSLTEINSMMEHLGLNNYSTFLDPNDDGVDEPYIPLPSPTEEEDIALDHDIDDAFLELGIDPEDSDYDFDSVDSDGTDVWEEVSRQPANLRNILEGMSSMSLLDGFGHECL